MTAAGLLCDERHFDGADLRLTAKVIVESCNCDAFARLPILQHVGAGTDRLFAEVVAGCCDGLPGQNLGPGSGVCEKGEERRERLLGNQADRERIRGLDAIDR